MSEEIAGIELGREAEHVGSGYARHTVDNLYVLAEDKSVAAENEFQLGIPYNELATGGIHGVEEVDVAVLACAAARGTECDFAQASDFAHRVGSIDGIHHIEQVAAFVGGAEKAVGSEFAGYQVGVDWINYRLKHWK